jgi:hypothetical protein
MVSTFRSRSSSSQKTGHRETALQARQAPALRRSQPIKCQSEDLDVARESTVWRTPGRVVLRSESIAQLPEAHHLQSQTGRRLVVNVLASQALLKTIDDEKSTRDNPQQQQIHKYTRDSGLSMIPRLYQETHGWHTDTQALPQIKITFKATNPHRRLAGPRRRHYR